MDRRHLLAYGLITFGLLALLARWSGGTGWLWLGVVAAAALVAYVNTRTYGFLFLGGVLSGSALGILLTDLFACDGVFLVSLGVGLMAVDRVEPRPQRWATYVGALLAGLGLLAGLLDSGVLGSLWLPLLLIAAGGLLLWRGRDAGGTFPPPIRPVAPAPPAAPETVAEPAAQTAAEPAPSDTTEGATRDDERAR